MKSLEARLPKEVRIPRWEKPRNQRAQPTETDYPNPEICNTRVRTQSKRRKENLKERGVRSPRLPPFHRRSGREERRGEVKNTEGKKDPETKVKKKTKRAL